MKTKITQGNFMSEGKHGERIAAFACESDKVLFEAAPDLLQACRCALADLEGLRNEGVFYEEEGKPPQVETIEELEAAIQKAIK